MPVHPTYPGVYIQEIPSGVHTITAVATSIAAFVGSFHKGPANAPLLLFSPADFEREYGGLDSTSETTYAVQQFFLNGGQQAWIVRVVDAVAQTAAIAGGVPPQIGGGKALDVSAGRQVFGESVQDPGQWGNNLRVEIDYETSDPDTLFNLTVSEVQDDGNRTTVLQTETYRNLTLVPNAANNARAVVNDGSRLIQIDNLTALPLTNGTLGAALTGAFGPPPPSGSTFDIDVGTGAIVCTLTYPATPAIKSHAQLRPIVEAAIRAASSTPLLSDGQRPLLSGASVDLVVSATGTRYFVRLGRATRPSFDSTLKAQLSGAVATALKLDTGSGASVSMQQYQLSGGLDGAPLGAGDTIRRLPSAMVIGNPATKTGIFALDKVDIFNILCLPEATTPASGNASDMQSAYTQAEAYVESRRAMLIVDIDSKVNRLDLMQTWMADNDMLRHPNAVVYFPRTNIPDPLNLGRLRSLPSSGTIAGLWARTDSQRGVWKAPAGTEAQLRNVASLEVLLTDPENGTLNPLGVNCLRNFPVYSNICWGARTLEGADVLASDWKYLPVRRTTLFLEESLYRGSKWIVFESNDEPLWSQIRLNIGAFMQDLFRQGAFQGSSPQQAFYVKCDGETTTQLDIDSGIVNIEVGFAPLKPAEFVILKIRQVAPSPA